MASGIASSCPPMTLREREVLNAIHVGFLIPPCPRIFQASATQVLNKTLLKAFINQLLTTIRHDNSSIGIPKTNNWGLKGDQDDFLNLDSWDPRQISQDVFKVIALPVSSGPKTLTPIYPQWAILGAGLRPSCVKSIQLPSGEVFEILGSPILLVIHFRMRVKISKKKTKIEETRNSILIPADLKVVDLVKAFKDMGNVSGISEMLDSSSDLRTTDTRTATELGWRHGTELSLDIL